MKKSQNYAGLAPGKWFWLIVIAQLAVAGIMRSSNDVHMWKIE
jgi:hypothetical protein